MKKPPKLLKKIILEQGKRKISVSEK